MLIADSLEGVLRAAFYRTSSRWPISVASPRAAELYCRQVAQGLDSDVREALKAAVFLRDWFSGKIRLEPLPDGGLVAH
jgi:hypothetical protein